MHYLVVGSLHERRINIAENPHALCRQTRAEGNRMLLTDAHINGASGIFSIMNLREEPEGMAGVMPNILSIFFRQFNDGMSKYILVFGRLWRVKFFFINLSGHLIKQVRVRAIWSGLVLRVNNLYLSP